MGVPHGSMGTSWIVHGWPMDVSFGIAHRCPMGVMWESHGWPMGAYGEPMGLQWWPMGNSLGSNGGPWLVHA